MNDEVLDQLSQLLDRKLEKIATNVQNMNDKFEALVGVMSKQVESLRMQVNHLSLENCKLNKELNSIRMDMNRKKLIFKGVDKKMAEEDPKKLIEQICATFFEINVSLDNVAVIAGGSMIKATFVYEREVAYILKNKSKLKGKTIFVQKDLPKDVRQKRYILHSFKYLIKKCNANAVVTCGTDDIVINGIKYLFDGRAFYDGEHEANAVLEKLSGHKVDDVINGKHKQKSGFQHGDLIIEEESIHHVGQNYEVDTL